MPGDVNLTKLLDLFASTLAKYPEGEYQNLLANQAYVFSDLFESLKPKAMSGTKCVFDAMIQGDANDTGDAEDGGPGRYGSYEVLGSEATEYLTQGEIPWSYYHTYWVVSSQELRHNAADKEGYIDLMKVKREGCITRLVNILESDFWSRTAWQHVSSSKPMILGPEYWITDDGYHINDVGGTAGTPVGGIDPTDSAFNDFNARNRWRNQYAQITDANELADAYDEMFVDCNFKAPPKVDTQSKFYNRFKIVQDKTTYKLYKRLQKRLRDNVGSDLSGGKPVFNNIELEMADRMRARSDGTYQTFFINTAVWGAWVDKMNNMRKDDVRTPDNQDARRQRIFHWPATACKDRRSQGKVFGYPGTLTEG